MIGVMRSGVHNTAWSHSILLRWLSVLSCLNSSVNPVIYGVMWRPFRTALVDVSTAPFSLWRVIEYDLSLFIMIVYWHPAAVRLE